VILAPLLLSLLAAQPAAAAGDDLSLYREVEMATERTACCSRDPLPAAIASRFARDRAALARRFGAPVVAAATDRARHDFRLWLALYDTSAPQPRTAAQRLRDQRALADYYDRLLGRLEAQIGERH
jgi:hypothetical protein